MARAGSHENRRELVENRSVLYSACVRLYDSTARYHIFSVCACATRWATTARQNEIIFILPIGRQHVTAIKLQPLNRPIRAGQVQYR